MKTLCFLRTFMICHPFIIDFSFCPVSLILYAITIVNIFFFCSSVSLCYFLPSWLSYLDLSLPKTSLICFCLDDHLNLILVEKLLPLKSLSWLPNLKTGLHTLALWSHSCLYFLNTALRDTLLQHLSHLCVFPI